MRALPFVATAVIFGGALFFACGGSLDGDHGPPDVIGNPVGDAAPVLAPDASIPGVTHDGWTWADGPAGVDLFGAWGSSASDVWYVGAAGTILHFDGHAFSSPDSGTGEELRGVWGSSASDVWAVGRPQYDEGDAVILHWDGSAWGIAKTVASASLYAVSGSAASDVWAVGAKGVTLHFDGATWTTVASDPGNDLTSVWTDGKDAWAVGAVSSAAATGAIVRWNGSSWSAVTLPTERTVLSHVWGADASDVWFAGADLVDTTSPGGDDPNGYLLHWNGASFDAPTILADYGTPLRAVFGSSGSDPKAVGSASAVETFDGSAWSSRSLPGDYEAIWESAPSDAWAVGLGGVMAHWDGASWTALVPPPPSFGEYRGVAIRANAPDDAWAFGNAATGVAIRRWDGKTWTSSSIDGASSAWVWVGAACGTSASDMWLAGSGPNTSTGRIVHWDGATWSDVYDVTQNYGFVGAYCASATDAWFSGDDALLVHWNGSTFEVASLPGPSSDGLGAVGGSSGSDVWIAGNTNEDLTVRHFDGASWSVAYTGAGFASGIWAASPSDAWIVGWEGTALHWNGATWTDESKALPREVGAVWGSSADDVWLVGWFGAVVHDVSGVPSFVPVTSSDVVGVTGTSASDVWMLTGTGYILHHP